VPKTKDATEPIRKRASQYPNVDEGTACTQSSFKSGGKAFLYIGDQGGRHKAMFKLQDSKLDATKLAKKNPDQIQVGSTAWVTARFTDEQPLPAKLWQKWLDESYSLCQSSATATKKKARKHK
jgi:predicted DNA-binding protein (MmcQ/YjbR family)